MHCTISKPETFVFSATLRNGFSHAPNAQSWAHFNLLGEYDFSNDKLQDNTGVLPPKTEPRIIAENWEPPNR